MRGLNFVPIRSDTMAYFPDWKLALDAQGKLRIIFSTPQFWQTFFNLDRALGKVEY